MTSPLGPPPTKCRAPFQRARRWWIVAVLATIAFSAVSLLTFDVSPAAAAGEQAVIDLARFNAQNALLRPNCRRLLSSIDAQFPPGSADQILLTATIQFQSTVPANLDRNTFASSRLGGGFGQTITIYPSFINPGPVEPTFLNGQEAFTPTPDQQRTILILHEVGHLDLREGNHDGDIIRQANYNTDILNVCLAQPPSFDYVPLAIQAPVLHLDGSEPRLGHLLPVRCALFRR